MEFILLELEYIIEILNNALMLNHHYYIALCDSLGSLGHFLASLGITKNLHTGRIVDRMCVLPHSMIFCHHQNVEASHPILYVSGFIFITVLCSN